ncbi:MAG: hypothetical protein H7Y16_10365 [Candidatus Parcubacteria bacterium]|nr:hypothetical protein [Burkholderiales bacterium]
MPRAGGADSRPAGGAVSILPRTASCAQALPKVTFTVLPETAPSAKHGWPSFAFSGLSTPSAIRSPALPSGSSTW